MKLLFILAGVLIVIIAIAWARHLGQLSKHQGLNRDEFISYFTRLGLSAATAAAVFDQFHKLGVWKGFMPDPSDRLEDTYKIVDEDVDYTLTDILDRLGLEMPDSSALADWDAPLETLEDVVRWVEWARKKQVG